MPLLLATLLVIGAPSPAAHAQGPPAFQARELAEYRLTAASFSRVIDAGRLIAAIVAREPRFMDAPLFTREVMLLGDAAEMATAVEARLRGDQALAAALDAAKITPREFTTFTFALFGAHLARGFLQSGALRLVPPGVTADNVAFVNANADAIQGFLDALRIDPSPGGTFAPPGA
jgi:hypothetical protein